MSLSDEQLRMIVRVLGSQLTDDEGEINAITRTLVDTTVRFRDKLLSEASITLTVEDARIALDAFENGLSGGEISSELSTEQQALAQLYLDSMTLFKKS